ncbi:MAG: hypothetical protein Q7S67_03615 [Telluria sp.]|nr:hypothetical protein [Telluria sp.]
MTFTRPALAALALAASVAGCGGGSSASATPPPATPPASADISVLMFGNSHTDFNNLPGMLSAMIRAARPGKSVSVVRGQEYMFLDERLTHAPSLSLFNSLKWSAVVYQAQKYSVSGAFDYSSTEAVEWVRMTRARPSIPVMFPEWPRRGVDETQRIYDLHVSIAARQEACVAPVGQAWDLSGRRVPGLVLHADDGNHAAPAGSFLAALVLYASLTGESPLGLPALDGFPVDAATQARLREVADEQVKLIPARLHCPSTARL